MRSRHTLAGLAAFVCLLAVHPLPAGANDGLLGVFFDRNGASCSGNVPTASLAILHVVLLTDGSTFGGVTGAELAIQPSASGAFFLQGEDVEAGGLQIGTALGGGTTIGFSTCHSGAAVAILSFQAFNLGSTIGNVELRVRARNTPSNPFMRCPLAVLCDGPRTAVCVTGSKAILNPSPNRTCQGGRESTEWTRLKDLYR